MAKKAEDLSWIHDSLSNLLDFPVPPDLIDYICSIENERDFTEYFSSLLDFNIPDHAKFVQDLRELLVKGQISHRKEVTVKAGKVQDVTPKSLLLPCFERDKPEHHKKRGIPSPPQDRPALQDEKQCLDRESEKEKGKKKPKFVNLYSQQGQAKDIILHKGRHMCTCEASKHPLVNNCLKCGRIVCEQEGAGPCFFCGSLVCTPKQLQDLQAGSKRSEKLRDHLMKQTISCDDEIAIQKRDKLLEYDKTSERLTKVIDDESDYYTPSSVWLSAEEKVRLKKREAEIHAQQHASRRDKKFTLDFSGRCVIEEQSELPIDPLNDPVLQQINQNVNSQHSKSSSDESALQSTFPDLKFVESAKTKFKPREGGVEIITTTSRIQDRELQEMSDQGMCLSMHQPWASLLVAGIKMHEGRSWYTTHRGLLWISAAAKIPTPAEIQSVEQEHRIMLGSPSKLTFPQQYPTACLLGCVNLVECLPQEDYRTQFPKGPSLEPYVFICENPRKLPIFFPMKSKHKIFKLEPKIHQGAQKSLKRVSKLQSEQMMSS